MDLDRFVELHAPDWQRLEQLVGGSRRARRRLGPDEVEELVTLYQRATTHLSLARTRYREPALVARLSRLVARAGSVLYGGRPTTSRTLRDFAARTYPAALWHARWAVLVAAALLVLPGVAVGAWVAQSPDALDVAVPEAMREAYVEEDFEEYYTADPSALFATQVTTNNIQVGVLAFVGGLLVLPTAAILALNGANVGLAGGLFAHAGEQARFWSLIVPHGLLELTAVFVAAAAGLMLGWRLIRPGDVRRGEALVHEGRRAIVLVLGTAVVFAVAGLIEGFVTGADVEPALRVAIGVVAWLAFVAYAVGYGRAAAAEGRTGAMGEEGDAGWAVRLADGPGAAGSAGAQPAGPDQSRPATFEPT